MWLQDFSNICYSNSLKRIEAIIIWFITKKYCNLRKQSASI